MKKCPSRFKTLSDIKLTLQKLPRAFNILPKWQNIAKSGHPITSKIEILFNKTFHIWGNFAHNVFAFLLILNYDYFDNLNTFWWF